jgi:hypothetical protein
VLLTDTVFIGEDDNAGGGSQAGLDASATYTLDVDGIQPHPNQGFHVKLTIHADGSQGADTKHKVFWVTGCPSGTTTTTLKATTTSGVTSSSGATSTSGTTTTTTSGAATSNEQPSSSSGVGGASSSAAGGSSGGSLPFTGANALSLLLAGLVLLGLGAGMVVGKARQSRL